MLYSRAVPRPGFSETKSQSSLNILCVSLKSNNIDVWNINLSHACGSLVRVRLFLIDRYVSFLQTLNIITDVLSSMHITNRYYRCIIHSSVSSGHLQSSWPTLNSRQPPLCLMLYLYLSVFVHFALCENGRFPRSQKKWKERVGSGHSLVPQYCSTTERFLLGGLQRCEPNQWGEVV